MPIDYNSRLGRYVIRYQLGASAIGEVYLAHDPEIGRDVLIKLLPPEFAIDEDRLQRFEIEVQAIGKLNHPNILPFSDVETIDERTYIVYEVPQRAETLRYRLLLGPLPSQVAIDYAKQIAQGLIAASELGIIHCNINPENILITSDSCIKILDFGLGQLTQKTEDSALMDIATRIVSESSTPVLETMGYKSPEQIREEPLDQRTDIFSLGVVLFEMLSGVRPFQGESSVETLDAVLKEDPIELTDPNPDLKAIVMRCLEKNPEKRFQSVQELLSSLAELSEPPRTVEEIATPVVPATAESSAGLSTPPESPIAQTEIQTEPQTEVRATSAPSVPDSVLESPSTEPPASATTEPVAALPTETKQSAERDKTGSNVNYRYWILIGILAVALLTSLYFAFFRDRNTTTYSGVLNLVVLTSDQAPMTGLVGAFSISPDGRRVAFVGSSQGKDSLWVRSLDSATAQELTGTAGVSNTAPPFWSPDGKQLGYFAGGRLKKVSATGGPPEDVCEAPGARGGSWSQDDVIIFGSAFQNPIFRTSAKGGKPQPLTTLDPTRKETSHRWPNFLPDGKHFLFLARSGPYHGGELYIGTLDSPERKHLLSTSSAGLYSAPGYILFMKDDALMAQQLNTTKLELSGEAIQVVPQVTSNAGLGRGAFSVSNTGLLTYVSGNGDVNEPVWFDRQGNKISTATAPGLFFTMCFSPDETRLAINQVNTHTGASDIWTLDPSNRGTPSQFTSDAAGDSNPLWSPDGSTLVFTSSRDGVGNLYQKSATGAGNEELLLKTEEEKWADDWTRDGKYIIYQTFSKGRWELWVLPMFGDRKPYPYLQASSNRWQASFSPDGRWVAYTSDESSQPEIYVQAFPAPSTKWRISSGGGTQPSWRRDGNELYYIAGDRSLMAVDVSGGFESRVPQKLFTTRVLTMTDFRNAYLPSSDGKRFLVNSQLERLEGAPINVLVNWTSLLK